MPAGACGGGRCPGETFWSAGGTGGMGGGIGGGTREEGAGTAAGVGSDGGAQRGCRGSAVPGAGLAGGDGVAGARTSSVSDCVATARRCGLVRNGPSTENGASPVSAGRGLGSPAPTPTGRLIPETLTTP